MKLSSKIIVAVLIIAGGSSAVYAFGRDRGGWHMSPEEKVEFVTERVTRELELNDTQRQNFESLANTVADIILEARASKQQHIEEIDGLLQDPSFNQARALEMVEQKTRMINEKAPLVVSSLAVFLDSLDSEQKQQVQELMEHMQKHRHGKHGR